MEWEEDFPYDGEYTFKYLADNVADFYLDNELIGRTKKIQGISRQIKEICEFPVFIELELILRIFQSMKR